MFPRYAIMWKPQLLFETQRKSKPVTASSSDGFTFVYDNKSPEKDIRGLGRRRAPPDREHFTCDNSFS